MVVMNFVSTYQTNQPPEFFSKARGGGVFLLVWCSVPGKRYVRSAFCDVTVISSLSSLPDYTIKGLCTIPCKLFEAYFIDVMQGIYQ